MAKQSGILKVEGTMGGITFYKSRQDGYLAREKGNLDATRIATDPNFQRTRENGAEFGKAGSAGKVLRTAFRALLINASDSRVTSRLVTEMVKVIKEDQVNTRGQRNVIDGEATLLMGFEFNITGKLSASMYAPFESSIDRVTGILKVDIPSYIPANMINAPAGATHYKINAAAADVDFENEKYVVDTASSAELTLDNVATAALSLSCNVPVNSTHPLFIVLGMEFFQEVNGVKYSLKNGAFNSLAIVNVDGGV